MICISNYHLQRIAASSHLGQILAAFAVAVALVCSSAPARALVPDNDDFAAADVLSGVADSAFADSTEAGIEPGEPEHAGETGGHSLWWRWIAPEAGTYVIDTLQSDFDTVLAVYTGESLEALTLVADNDDASGMVVSRVVFEAAAGTTYHIAVDGFDGRAGEVEITLSKGVRHVPADHPTIQAAIDAAVDGDTILVAPGIYVENVEFRGKGIVVASEDGPYLTEIVGLDGDLVTIAPARSGLAVLQGFTVRQLDNPRLNVAGAGIRVEGGDVLIAGNVIHHKEEGVRIAGEDATASISIMDNAITAGSGVSIRADDELAGEISVARNESGSIHVKARAWIQDNIVHGSIVGTDLSVVQNLVSGMIAAGVPGATEPVLVINNTLVRNGGQSGLYLDGPGIVANNVITGAWEWCQAGTPSVRMGNLFQHAARVLRASPGCEPSLSDSDIEADPRFANAPHDHRLLPESPAVDTGADTRAVIASTDLDGLPRVTGMAGAEPVIDRGAFESRAAGVFAFTFPRFVATAGGANVEVGVARLGGDLGQVSVELSMVSGVGASSSPASFAVQTLVFADGERGARVVQLDLSGRGDANEALAQLRLSKASDGAGIGRHHKAMVVAQSATDSFALNASLLAQADKPSSDAAGDSALQGSSVIAADLAVPRLQFRKSEVVAQYDFSRDYFPVSPDSLWVYRTGNGGLVPRTIDDAGWHGHFAFTANAEGIFAARNWVSKKYREGRTTLPGGRAELAEGRALRVANSVLEIGSVVEDSYKLATWKKKEKTDEWTCKQYVSFIFTGCVKWGRVYKDVQKSLRYSSRGEVQRRESITVPAGTFDTLRLQIQQWVSGSVNDQCPPSKSCRSEGSWITQTRHETLWLADGVGVVRRALGECACKKVWELVQHVPEFMHPVPESALERAANVEFRWQAEGLVRAVRRVLVGTAPGRRDVFDSGRLSEGVSAVTVPRLTFHGEPLWVRVEFKSADSSLVRDFRYLAPNLLRIEPSQATVLASAHNVRFAWDPGAENADEWRFTVGTVAGRRKVFDSGVLPAEARSVVVPALPYNGEELWVDLAYRLGKHWHRHRVRYTAATVALPRFVLPEPSLPLTRRLPTLRSGDSGARNCESNTASDATSCTLHWASADLPVTGWRVKLELPRGRRRLSLHSATRLTRWDSGRLPSLATSHTFFRLPNRGESLEASLYFEHSGRWHRADTLTLTAAEYVWAALLASHNSGSTLTGTTETFEWENWGLPATDHELRFGSRPGRANYGRVKARSVNPADPGAVRALTFDRLPFKGEPVHVTLRSKVFGRWREARYTMTAANIPDPELTSHAEGSVLGGPGATFTWNDHGLPVADRELRIGSRPGRGNFAVARASRVNPADPGAVTSLTFEQLPSSGQVVYLTHRWKVQRRWYKRTYRMTAGSL